MALTKTFEGTFSPKKLTRDEFIKRWVTHFAQFYNLANTTADYEALAKMESALRDLAGAAWDRHPEGV